MTLNPEVPIVYYRGSGIIVTSHYIDNGEARHRVADLRSIEWEGPATRSAHVLALVRGQRSSRWATLEAVSRGRRVVLYRSRNASEFQQVRRAVIRAVEVNRGLRL